MLGIQKLSRIGTRERWKKRSRSKQGRGTEAAKPRKRGTVVLGTVQKQKRELCEVRKTFLNPLVILKVQN